MAPRLRALPNRLQSTPTRLEAVTGSWRSGLSGSTARGYGYRWQQYRKSYLRRHPLCVMCQAKGLVVAATVVDHITPHQGDQRLFWCEDNHQPLCKTCHDSDKARIESLSGQR